VAYRWSCEITAIPAYDLFNAKVAYLTADGQWEFSGWVENLTYEEYLVHNSVLNLGIAQLSLPAALRTLGVTINYQFGE
jgi:iron complex outermembrane receptor protein